MDHTTTTRDAADPVGPQDVRGNIDAALKHVRMRLRGHGGDVVVQDVEDGVVSLDFQGACRGCPALALTYVAVVEPAVAGVAGVDTVRPPRSNIAPAVLDRIRAATTRQSRRA